MHRIEGSMLTMWTTSFGTPVCGTHCPLPTNALMKDEKTWLKDGMVKGCVIFVTNPGFRGNHRSPASRVSRSLTLVHFWCNEERK